MLDEVQKIFVDLIDVLLLLCWQKLVRGLLGQRIISSNLLRTGMPLATYVHVFAILVFVVTRDVNQLHIQIRDQLHV